MSAAIDVFIPVYNDREFLPAAIASVQVQRGVDLRIVVSDNASTDGTYEWLLEAAAEDPRIVVHRNPENIGLLGNLNRYRDLVEAPYFLLLCSDDTLHADDCLAKAMEVVAEDPELVSIYCDLAYLDSRGRVMSYRRFGRSGRFDAEQALRQSMRGLRNRFGIPLLNRTDVLRTLSYPAGLTYTADVHLSAQAARLGPVHHIAEPLIGNRYTGRNMTASVMHDSRGQFRKVETDFGITLSPSERLQQRISYPLVMLAKTLFLGYARMRR